MHTRRFPIERVVASAMLLIAIGSLLPEGAQAQHGPPVRPPAPLVAAASDLQFALDELVARFESDTGIRPRVTYGSSGNFTRQIEQGAPFELFLSADEAYVDRLAERRRTRDRGTLYAIGRIVLFAPRGSPLQPDPELKHLATRLASGEAGRLAIANPEHAPYGRAAEQALRSLGLWEAVQPRLLLGENVAQAAQYASSGNADGGIVAYSLALGPALRDRGTFVLLPASLHAPLRQRMVLLQGASPAAERLYDYLRSPTGRAILQQYGFALPGD
jgi:molybdate transport system substrate-binding protein